MRVAIVHYWFVGRRGGERVVEALCELFPQADLFSLIADRSTLSPELRKHKLTISFLQDLPGARRIHRYLLPLYPIAVEQFDLRGYDLVISTESGPAKGVLTRPETCHVCYCFTPMRYLWNFYHDYKEGSGLGRLKKAAFALTAHYARMWDLASASRVDHFATLSHAVAARIRKYYRREAEVIYPPVDVESGRLGAPVEDYYLVLGQLVNYKRVDLAIRACNQLGRPLRIAGTGEEYQRLKAIAGPEIKFLGHISDEEARQQYAGCRALLFPGEEDFGIVPVEAQSFGRPVIAYGRGGAVETVIGAGSEGLDDLERSPTGVFFSEQSVDSLVEAIQRFESMESSFLPEMIRAHAQQFNKRNFLRKMEAFLLDKLAQHQEGPPLPVKSVLPRES